MPALASSANCRFHASKLAPVLPHCAAFAVCARTREHGQCCEGSRRNLSAPDHVKLPSRHLVGRSRDGRAGPSKRIWPSGVEASPANRLPSATRTGLGMEEVRGFEDVWEVAATACFALALSQIDSVHPAACAWRPVAFDAQERTPGHLVVQRAMVPRSDILLVRCCRNRLPEQRRRTATWISEAVVRMVQRSSCGSP